MIVKNAIKIKVAYHTSLLSQWGKFDKMWQCPISSLYFSPYKNLSHLNSKKHDHSHVLIIKMNITYSAQNYFISSLFKSVTAY